VGLREIESWERKGVKSERDDPIYHQLSWLRTESEIKVRTSPLFVIKKDSKIKISCRKLYIIFLDRLENELFDLEVNFISFFCY